ncbi:MAG: hypothetical protein KC609_12900, partial [Myxococcales bacterium]|nr:hypothetical protein [Myxococcales bacterium]
LFFESVLDAQQGSVFAPRRVVAVSSVFTPRGLFQHRRRFARDMSVADRDGTLVRSSPLGVTRPRPGTRYELAFKP